MDISIKTITLFTSVLLTGLSAGFFYAWQVSVIPGTIKVEDSVYLQTMQSINRAILNPGFFIVFFGTLILLGISCIFEFPNGRVVFGFILVAFLTYLIGTFGVTALGNVPLNDQLDKLNLATLTLDKLKGFREHYESNWNRLHTIRTFFSVLSFLSTLLAFWSHIQKS